MATKVSITTGEAPVDIRVRQPNEAPHVRSIAPNSGYDFEVVGQAVLQIGGDITRNHDMPESADEMRSYRTPGTPVPSDQGNQRPSPDAKPHEGSTSGTSELQPETDEVKAARERGELPEDPDATGDTMPVSSPDADFEAENDANEFRRKARRRNTD